MWKCWRKYIAASSASSSLVQTSARMVETLCEPFLFYNQRESNFVRALAGWGKHIQIFCALAQSIFSELPRHSLEVTKRTHTTPKQPARANASGLCVGVCVWFAEVRVTTKRGYESASVAVRAEKRAIKSDKLIVLFLATETAKQNQKFPFHFFFRFAVEGWGEETRGKCKEIFWFLHTRVRERVRGALVRFPTKSERTRQFQATTRSARAISRNQGLTQNIFELCPIHTAKIF